MSAVGQDALSGTEAWPPPVLLVRPDANERDAEQLDAWGIETTIDPWLEVSTAADPAPAHRLVGMLAACATGTVLVVTSPRTWGHLGQLVGDKALERAVSAALGNGALVWCTGRGTAASLPEGLAAAIHTAPTGEALAQALNSQVLPGFGHLIAGVPLVLLPGSEIARPQLPAALAAGGWRVVTAPVYTTRARSERPDSAAPLASGQFSAVVVRSPSAVQALRQGLGEQFWPEGTPMVAAGPTTAAAARELGIDPVECAGPEPARVAATVATTLGVPEKCAAGTAQMLPPSHPSRTGVLAASPFLSACRGVRPAVTPVWFMRQAGRSLPEYRAARRGSTMLDSCLDPELASELTLQPVRRYGVDAAIFYSDIMVPLRLAGLDVDIEPGVGPVIANPIRHPEQIEALPTLEDDALAPIRAAVGRAVAELGPVPLIGFAGAPYTVASYLVEGRPDRTHPRTRTLMREHPHAFAALLRWVAGISLDFLRAQVMAGASAVQLFDSWAGELDPADYLVHVQPASALVLRGIGRLGVPRIHFGTRSARLLVAMRDAGADVMGVASDLSLDEANRLLGGRTVLQGNVDPDLLTATPARLDEHLRTVLASGAAAPAHIVNLAHGVPKDTDPRTLAHIVDLVHTSASTSAKGH
ncbi:uroporphyrinogen decarboxylase [Propionibacterium cyclohexanicum]|uniref:Uroporphyrinogen decarboxylase n=1 Tax=Propionibacterium cyclohexanicum TaxID=64702 RepID=A0A1H9SUV8_9ACTN|nr:uroporphyrinogen decarboxylase [Propionibacterium cyclohexanicum]SER88726.1 uroporphyrinogen decarboxylase [Propionibacterium cyclohexanicum]